VSFSDLVDNPRIAAQLQQSLTRGRLAHAYLFTGPRASNKETMARTLAKALNCLKKDHDSCDRCDSCRRIDAGTHPDIYWLGPESKSRRINVDQIREFERGVNLKPTSARIKVGLIVDADCLGEEASNGFLKTLEEPPAQTVIVLLTAEPQRLLPTILSRCLKLAFGPAAARTVSPYRERLVPLLVKFSQRDEHGIRAAYRFLAEVNALLQELRGQLRQKIVEEDDLGRYEETDPIMRARLEEQQAARVEGAYRVAREQVLEELYGWFGDLLLCVEGADRQLLEHPDQLRALKEAVAGMSSGRAQANLEAIEQIRESLARNISEPLALEVGFLKLAAA
jgi:DNA polymerase III subunit delta'